MDKKVVGMLSFDSEWVEHFGREILLVVSDDDARPSFDCAGKDVTIVGIGQLPSRIDPAFTW